MKKIAINIGMVILVTVVLGVLTFVILNFYTNHNARLVTVPNLEGQLEPAAVRKLKALELNYEISDTIYKDGAPKSGVINQNPEPGEKVKPGRKIYLVINSSKVPMVEMPDIAGQNSFDLAKTMLKRSHLKLGKVTKVVLNNVEGSPVLEQRLAGEAEQIKPMTLVPRNSTIDLVIGVARYGSDSTRTQIDVVPDVEPDVN